MLHLIIFDNYYKLLLSNNVRIEKFQYLDINKLSNLEINALACTKKYGNTFKGPGMFSGTNFNLQLKADYS